MAQLDACPMNDQEVSVQPPPRRQHFFVETLIDFFSRVFVPLPLIQEGYSLVSGERMYTSLVNRLED